MGDCCYQHLGDDSGRYECDEEEEETHGVEDIEDVEVGINRTAKAIEAGIHLA